MSNSSKAGQRRPDAVAAASGAMPCGYGTSRMSPEVIAMIARTTKATSRDVDGPSRSRMTAAAMNARPGALTDRRENDAKASRIRVAPATAGNTSPGRRNSRYKDANPHTSTKRAAFESI